MHTVKLALKNAMLKRKVKTLHQKVKRRNMKIKNMTQLIDKLRDILLIKTEEASLLHNNFDGLQLSMFRNTLQNAQRQKQGKRYTEAVKEFAITLSYILKRGTSQNDPQQPTTTQNQPKPPTTTQNHLQRSTKTHNHIIMTQNHPKYQTFPKGGYQGFFLKINHFANSGWDCIDFV